MHVLAVSRTLMHLHTYVHVCMVICLHFVYTVCESVCVCVAICLCVAPDVSVDSLIPKYFREMSLSRLLEVLYMYCFALVCDTVTS